MKTILVTGGAGYIGSHMVENLIHHGYEPIILDNLSEGQEQSIPEHCKAYIGDYGDLDVLNEIFSTHHIDAIMHFGAFASVPDSVVHPNIYYFNNVTAMLTLIDTALNYNIKNFIFSSSAATFGECGNTVIDETFPQNPINPYGYTKLVGEHILKDYHKAFGLNYCIFRYFCAAGASKSGKIGEAHNPETHVIPVMINKAMNNETFSIYGNDYDTPDGTCIRDFVHVLDIVEAHRLALEQMLSNEIYAEDFNLGSEHGYSILELINTMSEILNQDIEYNIEDRRMGDPAILIADSKKAQEKLLWTPQHSELKEILSDAINWHQHKLY